MTTTVLLLGLAVLLGAFVQSTLGFGIAVVAAPFVVGLEPDLMPGSILILGFVLPLVQLVTRPRDIAGDLLGWALGWRILLTPVGVWLVHVLPPRGIAAVVGLLVLVSLVLSVRTVKTTATRGHAALAGAVTGVSGTAASIGGPFLAMVLQREAPDRIRSTLAAFFVVGSAASLIGLGIGGELTREQVLAGMTWLPFLLVGHALAGPMRSRIDHDRMRQGVLGLCLVASLVVIVRAVLA